MSIETKILILEDEIKVLERRILPEDTGHIHTTIRVLTDRIEELRSQLNS